MRRTAQLLRSLLSILLITAGEGIQFLWLAVWALIISRNHLYRFLLGHAFADSIFELYNELELQQLLNQFFERATYYSVAAYEEARERAPVSVARARHEDRRATVGESRDQREER